MIRRNFYPFLSNRYKSLSKLKFYRYFSNKNIDIDDDNIEITKDNATNVARTIDEHNNLNHRPSLFMADELKNRQMERTNITGYGHNQFLVNNIIMHGSVLLLPTFMTLWKPKIMDDINEDSLELLTIMDPSIDLLVLGTGNETHQCPKHIETYLEKHNIFVHVSNSKDAAATFHYLNNNEHRAIAAAILQMNPDWAQEEELIESNDNI